MHFKSESDKRNLGCKSILDGMKEVHDKYKYEGNIVVGFLGLLRDKCV